MCIPTCTNMCRMNVLQKSVLWENTFVMPWNDLLLVWVKRFRIFTLPLAVVGCFFVCNHLLFRIHKLYGNMTLLLFLTLFVVEHWWGREEGFYNISIPAESQWLVNNFSILYCIILVNPGMLVNGLTTVL